MPSEAGMQRAVCSRQGGFGPRILTSDFCPLSTAYRLRVQCRAVKRRLFTVLSALSLLLFVANLHAMGEELR